MFRTDSFAESFHASFSRRLTLHHPQFHVFARYIVKTIKESRLRLEDERFNPKYRWRTGYGYESSTPSLKLPERSALALPIQDLVKTIFNTLHAKVPFEDVFEDDNEIGDDDSSEVAMELVED